jgi:hypothetical protein
LLPLKKQNLMERRQVSSACKALNLVALPAWLTRKRFITGAHGFQAACLK